ncbi:MULTISPECIES: terpene synthase family protein [unclassified Streptomyces]|uniref:Terpene synthase family protein n=1 Tax=Streptomyces sp. NBC_00180 TaxID=2903632 RepID=A0AAU1IBJ7_9ACTN|nr:terpene synthase family protein [Streptomyces sp. NBC_01017]WSV35077.1 terpene synthase family protein [Streptomyces sp. NBC_01017]
MDTLEWLEAFDLAAPEQRPEYAESSAWFAIDSFPFSDTLGHQLMARWSAITFIFDDAYCEGISSKNASNRDATSFDTMALALIEALENPDSTPGVNAPLTLAMRDFAHDVIRHYPPVVINSIVDGWRQFVRGQRWQVDQRGSVPTLDTFFKGRIDNVAIWLTTVLAAPGSGLDLDEPTWQTSLAQALILSGWSLPMIYNEWASYEKERAAGTSNINLVEVVEREYNTNLDEAVHETSRLHDQIMTVFLAIAHKCRERGGSFARWADFIEAAVAGNIVFHSRVARYAWPPDGPPVLCDQPRADAETAQIPRRIREWWREAGLAPMRSET